MCGMLAGSTGRSTDTLHVTSALRVLLHLEYPHPPLSTLPRGDGPKVDKMGKGNEKKKFRGPLAPPYVWPVAVDPWQLSGSGGQGGGASRSQSALHMHVLVCICSNVRQFHKIRQGGGGGVAYQNRGDVPPPGGPPRTPSRPTNSSKTQLKLFFRACDFLLMRVPYIRYHRHGLRTAEKSSPRGTPILQPPCLHWHISTVRASTCGA